MLCMVELPYMPCRRFITPAMYIKMKELTSGAAIRFLYRTACQMELSGTYLYIIPESGV